MRKVALSLFVLWTLTLAGCQSKAAKVKQLQDQYNAEYPYRSRSNLPGISACWSGNRDRACLSGPQR